MAAASKYLYMKSTISYLKGFPPGSLHREQQRAGKHSRAGAAAAALSAAAATGDGDRGRRADRVEPHRQRPPEEQLLRAAAPPRAHRHHVLRGGGSGRYGFQLCRVIQLELGLILLY